MIARESIRNWGTLGYFGLGSEDRYLSRTWTHLSAKEGPNTKGKAGENGSVAWRW